MSYTVPTAPKFIPCPKCGYEEVVEEEGLISRFTHRRRCWRCGGIYHGKTGRSAVIEHYVDNALSLVHDVLSGIF
jgi:hypothetical protein